MLNFGFEVTGEKQIARAFAVIIQETEDFRPVFKTLADHFRAYEKEAFMSKGASSGTKWEPLSSAYDKWKKRHYPGRPLLWLTGTLFKSLTGRGSLLQLENLMAVYGTIVPYAIYHQLGAGNLPARPLVKLTKAEKWEWTKEVHRYIWKLIKSQRLKV